MINLLLKIHKFFFGANEINRYKNKNLFLWLIANGISRWVELVLYIYLQTKRSVGILPKKSDLKNDNIVLSFTSFPARIKNVWMVVDSIIRQTMCPEHIQIWLSEEDFPKKEASLPKSLLRYKRAGLEICWVKENLRPHKKYLYAFMAYPDKCVITIDDDIYYRADLIESLWDLHLRFPDCACGHRGGVVVPNEPYSRWGNSTKSNEPSHLNYLTGCGGCIYPVNLFNQHPVSQPDLIRQLALSTDDLWLKAMELLNRIPVVVGEYYPNGPTIIGTRKSALMIDNCNKVYSRNDESWNNLNMHFEIDKLLVEINE